MEASGDLMNKDELKQHLETCRRSLSEEEFFSLILCMLENDPPKETRHLLKSRLLTYSFVDEDRVARYLEPGLYDIDPLKREETVLDLLTLARTSNTSAYKILTKFLGEEPTRDKLEKLIEERLLKLFSYGKDEE